VKPSDSPAPKNDSLPTITEKHVELLGSMWRIASEEAYEDEIFQYAPIKLEIEAFLRATQSGGTHALFDKRTQLPVKLEVLRRIIDLIEDDHYAEDDALNEIHRIVTDLLPALPEGATKKEDDPNE
jgi:hypothetical protein